MKCLFISLLLLVSNLSYAADQEAFGVSWDPVTDSRVTFYDLAWGATAGARTTHAKVPVGTTTGKVLASGWQTYYVAVRACANDTFCSSWSNELAVPWIAPPANIKVTITWQTGP